jgi:hypothetical protein
MRPRYLARVWQRGAVASSWRGPFHQPVRVRATDVEFVDDRSDAASLMGGQGEGQGHGADDDAATEAPLCRSSFPRAANLPSAMTREVDRAGQIRSLPVTSGAHRMRALSHTRMVPPA